MTAILRTQISAEIPSDSLRLFSELVIKLGGRLLTSKDEEDAITLSPPILEQERVGRMLKGARLRAGMTQNQLAKVIGVPQSHISEYETNKRRIPHPKAQDLARVLNTVASHFEYRE